jgi:hypothetical protein
MGDYKTVLDPDILLEFDHLGYYKIIYKYIIFGIK